MTTLYGPTYETRNKRYVIDDGMAEIIWDRMIRGNDRESAIRAFFEGIEAGRITELPA